MSSGEHKAAMGESASEEDAIWLLNQFRGFMKSNGWAEARSMQAALTCYLAAPQKKRDEWLLDASDKLADWCNLAGDALRDLMAAYERRIRTDCTPEQIEKKPWECREYIVARDVLDKKPIWIITPINRERGTSEVGR